jgi:hypothetical protein
MLLNGKINIFEAIYGDNHKTCIPVYCFMILNPEPDSNLDPCKTFTDPDPYPWVQKPKDPDPEHCL